MREIYFRLTDNCNLTCAHCYGSFGPDRGSMGAVDLEKTMHAIHKLSPMDCIQYHVITLTGGEPFTEPELLERAVQTIRHYDQKPYVRIQTNGYWAEDVEAAKAIVNWLVDAGIYSVDLTSDDVYHDRQCCARGYVTGKKAAENILAAKESLPKPARTLFSLTVRGANGLLVPFGRAKKLTDEHKEESQCKLSADCLTVEPDGSVLLCGYQPRTTIGSLLKTPLWEIRANWQWDDEAMKLLAEGGLVALARESGTYSDEEMEVFDANPCSVCDTYIAQLLQ